MTEFECNLPIVITELQDKAVKLEAKDVELQNQIINEVSTRVNADDQLQANINAEIIARTNADEAESNTRASVDQDLQTQIDALKNSLIPYGAVQYFARDTAPEGWMVADGSSISRTEYANLFTAIGTNFGVGDGVVTFNLPDLRGEFIRGWDESESIDPGRAFGSRQTDATKIFLDGSSVYDKNGKNDRAYGISAYDGSDKKYDAIRVIENGGKSADLQLAMHTTYGAATETRPRNIALLACIKY